ncbi:MAG: hypothetical protein IPL39_11625 [Opitutaceae bacterium]|nr:hypothetical protein [Opitutaceae bacterium]
MSQLRHTLALATLCAALATTPALRAADGDALLALLARLEPAAGWTAPEPARVAVGDGLFDLIDGGAELYHEFGFRQAASWQLETKARASIQVELYEMADAPAAYGEWSLMQSGKFTPGRLGQGSLRFGYYLAFWSGPYFASVTGAQADAATQAEVDRLGAQLAALLPPSGELPAWFTRLPAQDLQERKYFRGRIGLSNIPLGEITELFDSKEGLVATYPGCKLLLLHFASTDAAVAQLAASAILATARPTLTGVKADASVSPCTDTDGNHIVVRTRGEDLLAFVFTDEARFHAVAGQLE